MDKPRILVILGSIRQGRAGKKVAEWFMDVARGEGNAAVELADLLDYPLPLFDDPVPPSMREGGHTNPAVQAWLDKVAAADGYIIVTPEYNHSVPSALKNALDYPYKEWNGKPVGFVGYGGAAGGARAVEHLRQIAGELRMYDVRDQVLLPAVWAAFDADGTLQNGDMHAKNARLVLQAVIDLAGKLRARL